MTKDYDLSNLFHFPSFFETLSLISYTHSLSLVFSHFLFSPVATKSAISSLSPVATVHLLLRGSTHSLLRRRLLLLLRLRSPPPRQIWTDLSRSHLLHTTAALTSHISDPRRSDSAIYLSMFGLLLAVFGLFAIVVAGSLHISDLSARRICIGFLSGAALISMFASPLLIIKLVIRTRSVEFMPFYLSLSTFLMSTAFFLYGIFNFDPFIYVPNGIGAILGIVQLALFFYYKNTSGEASREPLLSGGIGEEGGGRSATNVMKLHEVMATKSSRGVYHRDLILDENGNLKVTDFRLSAFSKNLKHDKLLHTACRTPAYVASEVLAVFPAVPLLPIGRTAGSLLGAMLMVIFQVITPEQAYAAIDLPILGLLFGTMVVSVYLERADMFKYLGKLLTWKSWGAKDLLCRICLISAISSALFTNDTSCVVLTEFVLKIVRQQNLPPHPFLLAFASSANIGSSATPIGNPQILKDIEDASMEVVPEEEVVSHRFSPATLSHRTSLNSQDWNCTLESMNIRSLSGISLEKAREIREFLWREFLWKRLKKFP
ncbi:hypothetical protein TEA_013929 [Camellia sinensis var. sinensis]|uniref:Citrate transporter-like domain-containing protein n=1 Tax=Camellia sinensis var. sinensis TaxID=542762 RepID=A0A4S4EF55_CAMSN|nr:hypothetical protein TEA_013929 [Camellia sinensis var. sinensis]